MAQSQLVLLVELLGSFRENYFLKFWQININRHNQNLLIMFHIQNYLLWILRQFFIFSQRFWLYFWWFCELIFFRKKKYIHNKNWKTCSFHPINENSVKKNHAFEMVLIIICICFVDTSLKRKVTRLSAIFFVDNKTKRFVVIFFSISFMELFCSAWICYLT